MCKRWDTPLFAPATFYRATGVILCKLSEAYYGQLDLFGEVIRLQRLSNLYESVDTLREKYGKTTVSTTSHSRRKSGRYGTSSTREPRSSSTTRPRTVVRSSPRISSRSLRDSRSRPWWCWAQGWPITPAAVIRAHTRSTTRRGWRLQGWSGPRHLTGPRGAAPHASGRQSASAVSRTPSQVKLCPDEGGAVAMRRDGPQWLTSAAGVAPGAALAAVLH
jgi:hypothetical protein